jgi:CPA1 family monovalent cation:H+ antiporter
MQMMWSVNCRPQKRRTFTSARRCSTVQIVPCLHLTLLTPLAAASTAAPATDGLPIGQTAAILLVLTALLAWLNVKVVKLPTTIGVMALSLAFSLLLVGLHEFAGITLDDTARRVVESIDFEAFVMEGVLGFLLFAGALHVDLNDLLKQKFVILTLATLGVVASVFVVGSLAYVIFPLVGFELTFIQALLLGSVVTPTDPIAVLGLMKSAGVPKNLETKVTGESLFNDGVGVVVFLALVGLAYPVSNGDDGGSFGSVAMLFLVEVGGGIAAGLVAGLIAFALIKRIDRYSVEVLITLALAVGVYVFCGSTVIAGYHLSGPLAVVVAGLLIGNKGRYTGMSDTARQHVDVFWELVDEVLNAVLFVLIGLEVLILELTGRTMLVGLILIPIMLLARTAAVFGGVGLLKTTKLRTDFTTGARRVLVWAGLRGGISVALALAIPRIEGDASRDVIITAAYVVVAFSILVQGPTVPLVVRKAVPADERGADLEYPKEGDA